MVWIGMPDLILPSGGAQTLSHNRNYQIMKSDNRPSLWKTYDLQFDWSTFQRSKELKVESETNKYSAVVLLLFFCFIST